MRKRILVIILTIMLWPAILWAANVTVSVGKASAYQGSTGVEIPITVNNVTGLDVIAIDFVLTYDSSRISFDSLSTTGTIASSWGSPVYNSSTPGKLLIALYGTTPLIGQGDLLKLYFNVNTTASVGTSSLTLTKANINEASSVTSLIRNGTFTILAKQQKEPEKKQEIAKIQEQPETQEVSETQTEPKKQGLSVEQLIDTTTVRVEEASEKKVEKVAESIGRGVIIREEKKPKIAKEEIVDSERTTVMQQEQKSIPSLAGQRSEPEIELASVPVSQQKKEPKIVVAPERPIQETKSHVFGEELLEEKGLDKIKETKESLVVAKIKEQKKRWQLPFWKVYKIELNEQLIKPIRWKLAGRQKLPFGLRLDSKKGIIFGIAWGKGKFDLKLEVKTIQGEKINLPCTLEIK